MPTESNTRKLNIEIPSKKEKKSKQVHLLISPSNYEKLAKLAKENGRSVNDFLNCIIEQM